VAWGCLKDGGAPTQSTAVRRRACGCACGIPCAPALDLRLKETTRGSDNRCHHVVTKVVTMGQGYSLKTAALLRFVRRDSYVVQGLLTRDPIRPGNSFPVVFDYSVCHFGELRHVVDFSPDFSRPAEVPHTSRAGAAQRRDASAGSELTGPELRCAQLHRKTALRRPMQAGAHGYSAASTPERWSLSFGSMNVQNAFDRLYLRAHMLPRAAEVRGPPRSAFLPARLLRSASN